MAATLPAAVCEWLQLLPTYFDVTPKPVTGRSTSSSDPILAWWVTSLSSQHVKYRHLSIREWSLITGRGGLQNGRGGAREVLPLRKGGAEKVLAMLKGGHNKFWGRFYAVA